MTIGLRAKAKQGCLCSCCDVEVGFQWIFNGSKKLFAETSEERDYEGEIRDGNVE